jgi:hypothetical protein
VTVNEDPDLRLQSFTDLAAASPRGFGSTDLVTAKTLLESLR